MPVEIGKPRLSLSWHHSLCAAEGGGRPVSVGGLSCVEAEGLPLRGERVVGEVR